MDQPSLWWVNQGGSYKAELEGGFIWAPQHSKSGQALAHHVAVRSVRRGHRILHYWDRAIRAVGTATSDGHVADRPAELPSESWNEAGFRADVEYRLLDNPIALTEIPAAIREASGGLFNSVGGVNQGYLYPVPDSLISLRSGRFGELMSEVAAESAGSHGAQEEAIRRALCVYVSQGSLQNLTVGLEAGTWGWSGDHEEPRQVQVGDYLFLAVGGGGRVKIEEMLANRAQTLHLGRITRRAYHDTQALWPDEEPGGKSYGQRIGFELVGTAGDVPYTSIPRAVVGALQTSGTKQGRGFVAELAADEELQLVAAFGAPLDARTEELFVSVEPEGTLETVVDSFAAALKTSNVDYGERHEDLVRRFVCSLATKRFLILTGLSGSGKTRLAQAFGEWLGEGRSRVVAVRPDWTSPDYLLGYVNELVSERDRKVWSVPETLDFMLQAAHSPERPHLLILDEMNLAHVERYFADVLSGIESGKPVLPNLEQIGGVWQPSAGTGLIELPTNLFIVGTVNVDETTYMFSPKVLDRANTIEFRVETSDLGRTQRRPAPVTPGSAGLVARFLNDAEAEIEVDPSSQMGDRLKSVHELLSATGREFGHRTFVEALEFEKVYLSAGGRSSLDAFDVQLCQKVLPRLHGSKREIGPLLEALVDFMANDFPLSHEKLERMRARLDAVHFVSFAE